MSGDAPFPVAEVVAATAAKIGLVQLAVPGLRYPLWLRAATGDADACVKFLAGDPGGLRIPYQPRRILELGAGAGYRSIALANAFPDAEIIATEADPAWRAVNLLNTLPYHNITSLGTAVGDTAGRYDFTGRDPSIGTMLLQPAEHGALAAMPLAALLAARQWDGYDTVIITPDAASAALLNGQCPDTVRLIAVFTGGAPLPPEIAGNFPDEVFLARLEGDYVLLFRREVQGQMLALPAMQLFDLTGPANAFALEDVSSEPWGYFPIGAHGFRLHPNRGGAPAARLIMSRAWRGCTRLSSRLRVGHPVSAPVTFTISITAEPAGEEILRLEQTVPGATEQEVTAVMAPYFGPCRIVFATQMAAPDAENSGAWAEFIDTACF